MTQGLCRKRQWPGAMSASLMEDAKRNIVFERVREGRKWSNLIQTRGRTGLDGEIDKQKGFSLLQSELGVFPYIVTRTSSNLSNFCLQAARFKAHLKARKRTLIVL